MAQALEYPICEYGHTPDFVITYDQGRFGNPREATYLVCQKCYNEKEHYHRFAKEVKPLRAIA